MYFRNDSKKAQTILEYSIIITVVAIALGVMSLYVRRAIYANIKLIQDQVNYEVNADDGL